MRKVTMPSLDPCYNSLLKYISKHQGSKGFINTSDETLDRMYAVVYGDSYDCNTSILYEEPIVAVRVKYEGCIELLCSNRPEDYSRAPEEYTDAVIEELMNSYEWDCLKGSDMVYYIPTLFSIAENIEEYVESQEEEQNNE